MGRPTSTEWAHPRPSRRAVLRAGGLGLFGLGLADLLRLESAARGVKGGVPTGCSVLYLFQSGGPAQHETWDPKPDAPVAVRGEFAPIATATPGVSVSEHLPRLARRTDKFALLRTLSHGTNDHSLGHHVMLTGYDTMPVGFDPNRPTHNDWPSVAALATYALRHDPSAFTSTGLPPAVVLPHPLIHRTGRTIPGQMAGRMDSKYDPMLLNVAPDCAGGYGACPQCFHFENLAFTHKGEPTADFTAPGLDLPAGLTVPRLNGRAALLRQIELGRQALDAGTSHADRFRAEALGLLTADRVAKAFDVHREDPKVLDRYGRHQFGRSLVLARRLIEAGVRLVQVNLGNNETWDTHQSAFPVLKDKLLPPLDQALSSLLDDMASTGLLDRTLIVMAGEFGRTPRISTLPGAKLAGRDHWGALQSVFVAGAGVKGGTVVGESDRNGAYPKSSPYRPSDLAATVYRALGVGPNPEYRDRLDRPFLATGGSPIDALF